MITMLTAPVFGNAQLQALDEAELADVSGQVGIVLDDVAIIGDPDASVQLSFDTDLSADSGYIDHVSIYGSDSNAASCNPANPSALPSIAGCNGVDIGTAADPIVLDVGFASSTSYIELRLPGASSQSGIDLNFRAVVAGQGFDKNNSGTVEASEQNLVFADTTWWRIKNLKLPNTSMRLWSNNTQLRTGASGFANGGQPIGLSIETVTNLTADELYFDAANSRNYNSSTATYQAFAPNSTNDGPRSGSSGFAGNSDGRLKGVMRLSNVSITNMRLGWFPLLPLHFGSIDKGASTKPEFYLEMPLLPNVASTYNAFYALPKANISIGSVEMGTATSAAGDTNLYNVGSLSIQGLRVQHLRIQTGS